MRPGLAEFLIRSVLDAEFRELALADPDQAFEGFDLSADEREILGSRDERVLGLLGRVLQFSWPVTPAPHQPEPRTEAILPTQTLPEVALRLHLIPYAVESPDDGIQFSYAASLHPWTDEQATEDQATEDQATEDQATGDQATGDQATGDQATGDRSVDDATAPDSADSAAVDLMIRIAPTVISLPGSEPKVAYAALIQPPEAGTGIGATKGQGASSGGSVLSWRYYGDSAAAQQAAAAVGEAEPDQRYPKLLDLIRALRQGDDDA